MSHFKLKHNYYLIALSLIIAHLIFISACLNRTPRRIPPKAVKGVLDLSDWEDHGTVNVYTLADHRLDMVYNGEHRVDGQVIDYDAYSLYEAPGVEAVSGTGKMSFQHGDHEANLDFGIDPNKPLIPMRVIG